MLFLCFFASLLSSVLPPFFVVIFKVLIFVHYIFHFILSENYVLHAYIFKNDFNSNANLIEPEVNQHL